MMSHLTVYLSPSQAHRIRDLLHVYRICAVDMMRCDLMLFQMPDRIESSLRSLIHPISTAAYLISSYPPPPTRPNQIKSNPHPLQQLTLTLHLNPTASISIPLQNNREGKEKGTHPRYFPTLYVILPRRSYETGYFIRHARGGEGDENP